MSNNQRDNDEVGEPMVMPSLYSVRTRGDDTDGAIHASASIVSHQSMFLTASGSLIQFNAIMAAIHASVLSSTDQVSLKASFVGAL
jgi:hypothetical protein